MNRTICYDRRHKEVALDQGNFSSARINIPIEMRICAWHEHGLTDTDAALPKYAKKSHLCSSSPHQSRAHEFRKAASCQRNSQEENVDQGKDSLPLTQRVRATPTHQPSDAVAVTINTTTVNHSAENTNTAIDIMPRGVINLIQTLLISRSIRMQQPHISTFCLLSPHLRLLG